MRKHFLQIIQTGFLVLVLIGMSACARRTAVNKQLQQLTPQMQNETSEWSAGERSPEILVLMAFSGGGTRAAAFSYGVLQELATTKIETKKGSRSLLDEVDLISSVSGGSFTSAYYCLYGERIFADFEERFLRQNVESKLLWQLARPINWFRLISSTYGLIDLAALYYDEHIFAGATFADIKRPGAPRLVINATDLATGSQFPFVDKYFYMLCSDLDSYPISRAVAASSAVPVLFSPITIKNFAGSCGHTPPAWLKDAATDDSLTTRKLEARVIEELMDRGKRPWLHLVDGGISDNLGLRPFYNAMALVGDPRLGFNKIGHPNVQKILIISVDSHTLQNNNWTLKQNAPSLAMIIGSITSDQISRFSLDTIDIVRSSFTRWAAEISTPQNPVTFNFASVSFEGVKDADERNALNRISTSFNLSDKSVDRLIAAGRSALRGSREFQKFVDSVKKQQSAR